VLLGGKKSVQACRVDELQPDQIERDRAARAS
jgi:hypothetical protein